MRIRSALLRVGAASVVALATLSIRPHNAASVRIYATRVFQKVLSHDLLDNRLFLPQSVLKLVKRTLSTDSYEAAADMTSL